MKACCMIKPSALAHQVAIKAVLEQYKVHVLQERTVLYTKPLIHTLYDHMSSEFRDVLASRLEGQTAIALLVEVASLSVLLDIAGRYTDPNKCVPHSIRARFGTLKEAEYLAGEPWWENGFHRPIDMREVRRDIALFFA